MCACLTFGKFPMDFFPYLNLLQFYRLATSESHIDHLAVSKSICTPHLVIPRVHAHLVQIGSNLSDANERGFVLPEVGLLVFPTTLALGADVVEVPFAVLLESKWPGEAVWADLLGR